MDRVEASKFEAFNMSDTLRALGFPRRGLPTTGPLVLVVEEPESTMHPGALGSILDALRHAGRFMQVVVTTSPDILENGSRIVISRSSVGKKERLLIRFPKPGAWRAFDGSGRAAAFNAQLLSGPLATHATRRSLRTVSREHPTGRGRTRRGESSASAATSSHSRSTSLGS